MRVGIIKVLAMRWKIVPSHFLHSLALWLTLCNNSDKTLFSALTFGTWQILMHEKSCLIPIINLGLSCLNICQAQRELLKKRGLRPRFSTAQSTWQMLMHWKKTCLSSIIP